MNRPLSKFEAVFMYADRGVIYSVDLFVFGSTFYNFNL